MIIIGAGYSGLIAGLLYPQSTILEARLKPTETHKALLRFRSSHIGDVCHIPFQKVQVLKSIWADGRNQSPAPNWSNLYSRKVTGQYLSRSITNTDPVERFIAPEDFYSQLIDMVGDRIKWGVRVECVTKDHIGMRGFDTPIDRTGHAIVSTIPLGSMARACSIGFLHKFRMAPIATYRGKVKRCRNCFYTVYYPDPDFPVYRASITNDLLIIEGMEGFKVGDGTLTTIAHSLGMGVNDIDLDEKPHIQKYGKISPVDDDARKAAIYNLTNNFDVYSLGRFGTWRNILLDDVLGDLRKIMGMTRMNKYERSMLQV